MPRKAAAAPAFHLTQRKGVWYVWWRENGNNRRRSCGTTSKIEAARFLAEFVVEWELEPPPTDPTIGQILEGYQAARADKQLSDAAKWACKALSRHLGNLPVTLLKDRQVEAYVAARRAEGCAGSAALYRASPRPISDGTLIRELGVLRTALMWALRKEWIDAAPYVELPPKPPPRSRWLTREEADRLIAVVLSPHLRLFILLALYTAGRTSALLELRWEQVDQNAGRIDLGRGRGNKKRAIVPIARPLGGPLAEAAAAATTPYVVEYGGKKLGSIKHAFADAAERAGLTAVTPHVLRHTSASWMVQAGVSFDMVATYLGNSAKMVREVYGHLAPDHLQAAMDALAGPQTVSGGVATGNTDRSVA